MSQLKLLPGATHVISSSSTSHWIVDSTCVHHKPGSTSVNGSRCIIYFIYFIWSQGLTDCSNVNSRFDKVQCHQDWQFASSPKLNADSKIRISSRSVLQLEVYRCHQYLQYNQRLVGRLYQRGDYSCIHTVSLNWQIDLGLYWERSVDTGCI
jgi:hypothetical protein